MDKDLSEAVWLCDFTRKAVIIKVQILNAIRTTAKIRDITKKC